MQAASQETGLEPTGGGLGLRAGEYGHSANSSLGFSFHLCYNPPMVVNTQVALARRAAETVIAAQRALITQKGKLPVATDVVSELVAVLNENHQIVYTNQAFLDFLQVNAPEKVYGLRLGELLHCIHAAENEGGCGTTPNCRYCVALGTVLTTMEQKTGRQDECLICRNGSAVQAAANFRIRTIPLQMEGQEFVILSLQDLNHEKRKAALERIFFHDILNTVSSLKVNLELLKRTPGIPVHLLKNVNAIADALSDEIKSQKMLVSAENRTLQVTRDLISSLTFLKEILEGFCQDPLALDKELELASFSEAFSFVSDSAILHRVLVNALKNALEASPEGSRITLSTHQSGELIRFQVQNPGVIPPHVLTRLFYRYYSTKGENRGLGTYSMKLLTEEYLGGEVKAESAPASGTIFSIILPRDIRLKQQ